MIKVILCCRVSTDEQAEGCSLDMQERSLRAYCANHGFEVIDVYRDDYSAKDYQLKRPELKKLYDYCRKHPKEVDKVLFLRWDRFTRNVEFAMTFKRKFYDEMGVEINATENPIDFKAPEWSTVFPLYCGVAHTEDIKISKRTKEGIHGTLLKGKSSGRVPLGYRNVRISKHDCWVEVDTKEAEKIKALFAEVAKGLEEPGVIRKRLCPDISDTTFRHRLRNRFYVGDLHVTAHGDEPEQFIKGIHEALIDRETFDKVQAIMGGDKKEQPKVTKTIKPELYLRKVLVCPVCGNVLTGAFSKGNGGRYPYYFCNREHKHLNIRAEKVNDGFADYISALKPHHAIVELYKEILDDVRGERTRESQAQMNKIQAEINSIKTRMDRVKDMYFDGEISKAEKEEAIERYSRQIATMSNQIQALKCSDDSNLKAKLDYSINLIEKLGEVFAGATPEIKLKIIGSIFPEKIQFDGKKYRTNSYNQVFDYIYTNTKQLQGKENENDSKNRSHCNKGCDVGLEPTTPRTTIWCSTN